MKPNLQAELFKLIKGKLPAQLSLVDEISSLLSLSQDSAYRRIRGETALTLDEAGILCRHFNLPLDGLLLSNSSSLNFHYRSLTGAPITFELYMQGIVADLQKIHDAPEREIIYYAKDIPFFHFFLFPEIARFKIFFWLKTIFDDDSLKDKKFKNEELSENGEKLRMKAMELYSRIPTKEIWSDETANTTLQQIEYYYESGLFDSNADAILLCDKMAQLLEHLCKQAAISCKFIPGREPSANQNSFLLYRNEILIGDNSILVQTGKTRTIYILHNVLNYLVGSDESFAQKSFDMYENLMRKGELISGTSEKARNKYFMRMQERVSKLKEKLTRG